MTQGELAKQLEISQSSVSRALNNPAKRNGRARTRISIFMQERRRDSSPIEAVKEIWDGSEQHAEALSTLIRASKDLWPGPGKEKPR